MQDECAIELYMICYIDLFKYAKTDLVLSPAKSHDQLCGCVNHSVQLRSIVIDYA